MSAGDNVFFLWLSIAALVVANLLKSYRLSEAEQSITELWRVVGVVAKSAAALVDEKREEPKP